MAQAGQELEAKRVIDHTAIVKSEKNPRHKPSVNKKVDSRFERFLRLPRLQGGYQARKQAVC